MALLAESLELLWLVRMFASVRTAEANVSVPCDQMLIS